MTKMRAADLTAVETAWWKRRRDAVLSLVEAVPAKPWGVAEGGR